MNRHVENPLAEWQVEIKNRNDLVTDPDAHRAKLVALAMQAHRRRQVSGEQLCEMLEMSDAARLWALLEWEEAHLLGLFLEDAELEKLDAEFCRGLK